MDKSNLTDSEKKFNIAIDGPSGSGKGTTAKLLAKKINYKYLDTGAMYRAVALYMNRNNILLEKFESNILKKIHLSFDENNHITLNGEVVEGFIRCPKINKLSSDFSVIKEVREFLVDMQKKIVSEGGYIAEGRDIGTVVMPDATIKIYLTATIEARAKRRFEDFKKQDIEITLDEVEKIVYEKDKQDMTREISPLIKCEDAIEVDTSNITIDEQVEKIYQIYISKIKK